MLPIITTSELPVDTRRGGEIQTVLSPRTTGCTSGFMGVARLAPGETIAEHYHPYSEEFVYVIAGTLEVRVDGEPHELAAGQGLVLPINARHRLANHGTEEVQLVFHLGPLAPRPELGHVDTEAGPHERRPVSTGTTSATPPQPVTAATDGAAAAAARISELEARADAAVADEWEISTFWWTLLHAGAAMGFYAGSVPPGIRRAPAGPRRRPVFGRRRSVATATSVAS